MNTYTKLAADWLADHPTPEGVTSDPDHWANETGTAIRHRTKTPAPIDWR